MRKTKFLASSLQRAQSAIMISETGVISKEVLPIETGYISATEFRATWLVLHQLKILIRNKQGGLENDPVLLISERSYLPLDPFGRLTSKERADIAPLSSIAKIKHAEKRSSISEENNTNARDRLLTSVANGGIVAIVIIFALSLALKKWGGG